MYALINCWTFKGTAAIRKLVDDFHARNVKVLFPVAGWDNGTVSEIIGFFKA